MSERSSVEYKVKVKSKISQILLHMYEYTLISNHIDSVIVLNVSEVVLSQSQLQNG